MPRFGRASTTPAACQPSANGPDLTVSYPMSSLTGAGLRLPLGPRSCWSLLKFPLSKDPASTVREFGQIGGATRSYKCRSGFRFLLSEVQGNRSIRTPAMERVMDLWCGGHGLRVETRAKLASKLELGIAFPPSHLPRLSSTPLPDAQTAGIAKFGIG